MDDQHTTRALMQRFHDAFEQHRPEDLDALIGEDCVLENTTPAPDGARYQGRADCLRFWKGIAANATLAFDAEDICACADLGIIRWQLHWGNDDAERIRGVNIMRVRDGRIVKAAGYVKGT